MRTIFINLWELYRVVVGVVVVVLLLLHFVLPAPSRYAAPVTPRSSISNQGNASGESERSRRGYSRERGEVSTQAPHINSSRD
jgi:hypothetical protein